MESGPVRDETIAAMERVHTRLCRDALEIAEDDFRGILGLGSAILLHGLLEPGQVYARMTWLDEAFVASLVEEHERLDRDLSLLEELISTDPISADASVLAAALRRRILDHLERDDRSLYGPLSRLQCTSTEVDLSPRRA